MDGDHPGEQRVISEPRSQLRPVPGGAHSRGLEPESD